MPQSGVHAIGAVNDFLEFLCRDCLADFPDAKARGFWTNGTKRMVAEARTKVFGYRLELIRTSAEEITYAASWSAADSSSVQDLNSSVSEIGCISAD